MNHQLKLRQVRGSYGIARLAPDTPVPSWINGAGLVSFVRAEDELTIVCAIERIPPEVEKDGPWSCIRSVGPFAFQATGIVQSLVNPLSNAGIGVFVICTFDGEHLLISTQDAEKAKILLVEAGHMFGDE